MNENKHIIDIKKFLVKLLNIRVGYKEQVGEPISYHPSTSWQKVGQVTFTKSGYYYFRASWNSVSTLGIGVSQADWTSSSPSVYINEHTSGGTTPGIYYVNLEESESVTMNVHVKCTSTSSTGTNYINIYPIEIVW